MIGGLGASSDGPSGSECSRAGCRASASVAVSWRNPRIHGSDRVKVWLACDEHADYLRDYLAARDFPVLVTPLGVEVSAAELSEAAR